MRYNDSDRLLGPQAEPERLASANPDLRAFWQNLQESSAHFETLQPLPGITVDGKSRYHFLDPR